MNWQLLLRAHKVSHRCAQTQALSKTQVVSFPLAMRKPINSAKRLRAHDGLASMVLSAGGTAVDEVDKNPIPAFMELVC